MPTKQKITKQNKRMEPAARPARGAAVVAGGRAMTIAKQDRAKVKLGAADGAAYAHAHVHTHTRFDSRLQFPLCLSLFLSLTLFLSSSISL